MPVRAAGALVVAWLAMVWSPAAAEPEPRSTALFDAPVSSDDIPRGQIRFRSFGAADGLRNLFIVGIVQDGNGLIWVATDDGAYRYDGQQFIHYSMQDGLPSMGVRALGVAPDGAVCAGTRDGLACWDGARFTPAGARGLPPVWIQALASGPGTLWAGTAQGLFVRRGDGPFVPAAGWPSPTHAVRTIWADAEGVVAGDDAVLQVSAGDGTWRQLGVEVGLGRERIEAVLRDRDGTLWIRSLHYLWTLPRGASHVSDLSAGLPSGLDKSGVGCGMALSPWGDVLVGSDSGVAYRRNGSWQLIDRAVGMPALDARALFVDHEGTIWIGSVGLFQWMGRGLVSHHDIAHGLPADVVWTIGRDPRGALWIGTGQCLARALGGRWECLPASKGWSVRSFVFAPQGGVFFGGGPPDPLYVDAAGRPTPIELAGDRPTDRHVMALTSGPDGDVWFATTNGLFRLPGAIPGRAERVTVPGTRGDTRYISILHVDGRLWVAGEAGLAVLDRGHWRLFDSSSGFRASQMRHVIRRRDGRMCVSFTDVDGVTCFRSDGISVSELKDISLADGLTSGRIYFLGEDSSQRLWIGTGDGVDVVTAHGADHFSESDGLAGNDSSARAFFEDTDRSIWLGASTGLSNLLAQRYLGPPAPPHTALLYSQLGGRPIRARAGEQVQAPHDRNAITASFAADSFVAPGRLEFQFRLSPLESEWSTTRTREARYPALPPGSYQLEMRARLGGGPWGAPAELQFAILPAWWQTRWFIAIAGAIVLAMVGAIITWRQRVLWRRRATQLQQRSNASFRDLIESMPDLVAVHSGDKLTYLNEAARQMLGLDGADEPWRDINLLDRLHPDDQALATRLFREARSSETHATHVVELRVRAGDGSWRHCELSGRQLELAGDPVMVISGRDVTERHRLRAKLMLSDRMVSLGTLAAGIAHEINNPLAYVTANLEVVAESLGDAAKRTPEEQAELQAAIGDAREGAERVRKIVRGLRTFSRSEEEKRVPLALGDVLAAAIRMTGNELKHRAVLVRELGDTPLILADDGRLTQVFINLLINAAHAIPEGNTDANRITVRTRTDDQGRAVIEIEDSGVGMPPDVQARAFDPFFTTKEVGEGTGLGLSICHGIITGLGGQITIESTRGQGSTVRVVLPPAPVDASAPPASRPPATDAPARRHRVMIVDDEPRVAQALKRMLHGDHDLILASCGAEAIAHVAAGERFDAIITDVMMPNMTGIELFDRLERLAPDQATRVIFLSGGVFTSQTQRRLETSGNPQLQKPVSSQELRACVARLVARAA